MSRIRNIVIALVLLAPSAASADVAKMTIDAPGVITYDFYLPFVFGFQNANDAALPGAFAGNIGAHFTVDWNNAPLVTSANIVTSGSIFNIFQATTYTAADTFFPLGLLGSTMSLSGPHFFALYFDITSHTFTGGTEESPRNATRNILMVNVPGPVMGAGIPGLIAACAIIWGLGWRRRNVKN
jgi:hypothetical protein